MLYIDYNRSVFNLFYASSTEIKNLNRETNYFLGGVAGPEFDPPL